MALLIIITFELIVISSYHSSSNSESIPDQQANQTDYIIIAKIPSVSSSTSIYLYGNGIFNISITAPGNTSYFTIEKPNTDNSTVLHIVVRFNASSELANLPTISNIPDLTHNITFFRPVLVELASERNFPFLTPGLFNEHGYEMLILSVRQISMIYYEEVSK